MNQINNTNKNILEKQIEETVYGWANYGGERKLDPRMQKKMDHPLLSTLIW